MEKQGSTTQLATPLFAHERVTAWGRVLLGGALIVAALVCAALVMGPTAAYADDDAEKHALPSIKKAVSLDGKSWSESVESKAGGKVFYKLVATLSETVADDDKADYIVVDTPAKEVRVEKGTVKASLVDSRGNEKTPLAVDVQLRDGAVEFALGNLKASVSNLKYGDEVQIVYEATVSNKAPAGRYQNVAKLSYDIGKGFHDTVGVRALVEVREQPQQPNSKESLPKTGDALPAWAYFAVGGLLAASVAALVAGAMARRKGKERG